MTETIETTAPAAPAKVAKPEIVRVVESANLEKADQQNILTVLGFAFDKISEYRDKADQISVEDENDKEAMKSARELRLSVKKTRTEGENARKKLKEDALRKGNTIDAVWRIIKAGLEPIESDLEEKEKTAERILAARREELQESRKSELAKYNFDGSLFPLGDMAEDGFNQLLFSAKAAEEKRQADLIAAEQARIAAEEEERERKRIAAEEAKAAAEAARIAALEAEEARKAELEKLQAENARLEKERRKKEAADRKAEEERNQRREKARVAAEKALAKIGFQTANGGMNHPDYSWFIGQDYYAEIDSNEEYKKFLSGIESRLESLRKEKEAKEQAAALQAKLEAVKKEEEERLAKEKAAAEERATKEKAKAEAEKAARLAPDKEKLMKLADDLDGYPLPELSSPEASAIISNIRTLLSKTANYAREKANEIGKV